MAREAAGGGAYSWADLYDAAEAGDAARCAEILRAGGVDMTDVAYSVAYDRNRIEVLKDHRLSKA